MGRDEVAYEKHAQWEIENGDKREHKLSRQRVTRKKT